jgi:SAM-dependent methyltransferase
VTAPEHESTRLSTVYARYATSRRKRRAWDAANPGNAAMRKELLRHLWERAGRQLSEGSVLDVGCGNGWLLRDLLERRGGGQRLHGVDLLSGRVAEARRSLPGVSIEIADARALPYPEGSFEAVLMITLLSSLPDSASVARAVSEGLRVLTPGGILLCYEPRVPNPFNRFTRFISRRELERAAGANGNAAEIRAVTVLPPLARRLGDRAERLYPRLARLPPLLTHRLTSVEKGR